MDPDCESNSVHCKFQIDNSSASSCKTDEEHFDPTEKSTELSSESAFMFVGVDSSDDLTQSNSGYSNKNVDSEEVSVNRKTSVEDSSKTDESSTSEVESTTLLDDTETGMDVDPLNIDFENVEGTTMQIHPSSSKSKTQQKGKQKNKKEYACDYPGCNAKFSRPWKLSAHHCQHTGERPFMCSRVGCTKSYTNPTHLRRHDLKVHGVKGDDTKRYKCTHPNCWLKDHPGFITAPGLKKHEDRHKVVDKNGLVCTDCSMCFTRLNDLKTHRFIHDNILPFQCDFCGRGYLHNMEYRKHLRSHKKYKCQAEGCESLEFPSFKELQKHNAIHNDFTCQICQKEFPMQCRLRVHLEEMHSTKPTTNQWRCTVEGCGRIFTLRRNMMQHVKQKHQGSGHPCPFQGCDLKFVWKQSLNKHMQQHLLDTPVEPKPPKGLPRAKRKDAEIPKATTAEILSSVVVDKQTKDQLLNKEEFDTDEEIIDQLIESPQPGCGSNSDVDVS